MSDFVLPFALMISALAPAHLLQRLRVAKGSTLGFLARSRARPFVLWCSPATCDEPRNFVMDFGVTDPPKGRCATPEGGFERPKPRCSFWRSGIGAALPMCSLEHKTDGTKRKEPNDEISHHHRTRNGEENAFCNLSFAKLEHSTTTIAALLFLAATFPDRQFNSAELCVLSGIGRTAISQIKDAKDTPFSLGNSRSSASMPWLCEASRIQARVRHSTSARHAMKREFARVSRFLGCWCPR